MKKIAITLCFAWAYLYALAQNNINQYDYWFDGNFTDRITTNIAPTSQFTLNTGISTSALENGLHVLNVRFRDDNSKYSSVISQFFQKINQNLTGNSNLAAYEYWFDNDYANRVSQSISPQTVFTLDAGIATTALGEGLHVFHIRFQDVGGSWSSTVSQFFQKINENLTGNNLINAYEYWFDNDYANRVSQAVTPQTIYTLNMGVPMSTLEEGLHVFHVRFQDVGGNWSSTVSQFFQKINENLTGNNQVVGYEYWFNGDYANRVHQPVTGQTIFQLSTGVSTGQLDKGLHVVHIRFEDAGGNWSSPVSQFFQKSGESLSLSNVISSYRYWFDDDTDVIYNASTNTMENPLYLIRNHNTTQLDTGLHVINLQFKDTIGQWSAVVIDTFVKLGNPRIDFVSPSKGGNTGDVTISIAGAFYQPVKVRLERQGELPIIAPDSVISLFNGQLIKATFDLRNKPIGVWNVIVEIVGDTTMVKENAFIIEEGNFMKPWTELIGFPVIRANTWQNYSLKVGNSGNINLYGVPVCIGIPIGMEVDFLFEPLVIGDSLNQYDTIANYVILDTLDAESIDSIKLYSFLVGLIPPNSVVAVNFRVKSPSIGQDIIWTWATTPLFGSPLKPELADCLVEVGGLIVGAALGPGAGCLYDVMASQLSPIIDGAIIANNNPNATVTEVVPELLGDYVWSNFKTIVGCFADPAAAAGLLNPVLGTIFTVVSYIDDGFALYDACSPLFNPNSKNPSNLQTVNSFDPNEKLGPIGGGAANFHNDLFPYPYAIHFENVDSATANAQTVLVLDTLDSGVFDYTTFQLGDFNVGDTIINVPPGRRQYQTLHNMVAEQNVMVRITATFNDTTGIASWLFESLDPQTLAPVSNPFDGFLPPNQTAPEGEGAVHYSIKVKASLPVNTPIVNSAGIYFDSNPPIFTNQWQNTLDNIKPHSQVNSLAAVQNDTLFAVSWTGIDTSSGIKHYDVYVAINNGDYRLWLSNVNFTSTLFEGEIDSIYSFYSVATDLADNVELKPSTPDATTTILLTDVEEFILESGKISIYPNPASQFLMVEGREFYKPAVQISVKDVFGRELFSDNLKPANGTFSTKIDIAALPSGVYIVQVKSGNGTLSSKIFKE